MDNEHDTMNLARELLTPCGYDIPAVRAIGDNVSDDAFRRIFSREETDGDRRIVREALRRYGPDLRAELAQRTQGVWPSGVPVYVPAPPKIAGSYAERCRDAALGIVERGDERTSDRRKPGAATVDRPVLDPLPGFAPLLSRNCEHGFAKRSRTHNDPELRPGRPAEGAGGSAPLRARSHCQLYCRKLNKARSRN